MMSTRTRSEMTLNTFMFSPRMFEGETGLQDLRTAASVLLHFGVIS